MLWSLGAGPLVNASLMPILYGAVLMSGSLGWAQSMPNAYQFLATIQFINMWLLIFNMMPIYPLDGGQILRSHALVCPGPGSQPGGGHRSGYCRRNRIYSARPPAAGSEWLLLIAGYMLLNCWGGLKAARALIRSEKLPRREGFLCPGCGIAPAVGTHWKCPRCGQTFDTFETGAVCPLCKSQFSTTMCLECQQLRPMSEWIAGYYASRGAIERRIIGKVESERSADKQLTN